MDGSGKTVLDTESLICYNISVIKNLGFLPLDEPKEVYWDEQYRIMLFALHRGQVSRILQSGA